MNINFDKLTFIVNNENLSINKDYYDKITGCYGCTTYNLNKEIIKQSIGINKIIQNESNTIIQVSGKIMADKNYLGYLNKNNYEEFINRLNSSKLLQIENISSNEIQVLACDTTKDIKVEDARKSLFGIYQYLNKVSDKYTINQRKNLSLFIKPYSSSRKYCLNIYKKYDELKKHNLKPYIDVIGHKYLEECKNLIRIELRLASFKEIRTAFDLRENEFLSLDKILESNSNPIASAFTDLKLTEDIINEI